MPVKPLKLPAHDPKVKKIILEGVSILQSQSNPNVAKVAQELTATHGIVCPYTTLFRRFNGKTQAASDAHIHQQLLTPAAETVVADWLFLSETVGVLIAVVTGRDRNLATLVFRPRKSRTAFTRHFSQI